jgi:hypothetical protein
MKSLLASLLACTCLAHAAIATEAPVTLADLEADPSLRPTIVYLTAPLDLPVLDQGKVVGEQTLPVGTRVVIERAMDDGQLTVRAARQPVGIHHTQTDYLAQATAVREQRVAEALARKAAEAALAQRAAEEEARAAAQEALALKHAEELREKAGPAPTSFPLNQVKQALRSILRDPDSLRIDENQAIGPLLVTLPDGPAWQWRVVYRARNGFGGYSVSTCIIQHRGVRLLGLQHDIPE